MSGTAIRENITHTEYSGEGDQTSLITHSELNINEGYLEHDGVRHEIKLREVQGNAERFFKHEIEYYPDTGKLKSVTFEHPAAFRYYMHLTEALFQSEFFETVVQVNQETKFELYDMSGGFSSDTLKKQASNTASSRIYETIFGKNPPPEGTFNIEDAALQTMETAEKEYYDSKMKKYKINFEKDGIFSDNGKEVLTYLEKLQSDKAPITQHDLDVALEEDAAPLRMRRIIIGQLPSDAVDQFFIEKKAVDLWLYAYKNLGLKPLKLIEIFDNMHIDSDLMEGRYSHISEVNQFIGGIAQARSYKKIATVLLTNPASKVVDKMSFSEKDGTLDVETHFSIPRNTIRDTIRHRLTPSVQEAVQHELVHLVDPNVSEATIPQKEGFATSFAYEFSFDRCIQNLREKVGYATLLTAEKLEEILSSEPRSDLSKSEQYLVPAAFFSHIVEKLGPEKFMKFYNVLVNGNGDTDEKLKGNISECLRHVDDGDPLESINDFLDRANAKIK